MSFAIAARALCAACGTGHTATAVGALFASASVFRFPAAVCTSRFIFTGVTAASAPLYLRSVFTEEQLRRDPVSGGAVFIPIIHLLYFPFLIFLFRSATALITVYECSDDAGTAARKIQYA